MGGSRGDVLTERSFEVSAYSDYRSSHQTPGYGTDYTKTFCSGYYAALWLRIERPPCGRHSQASWWAESQLPRLRVRHRPRRICCRPIVR